MTTLTLTSGAAPDASFHELVDAAVRRGFAGLELEDGHGHGLTPYEPWSRPVQGPPARAARRLAREAGVPIVAYRPARRTEGAFELAAILDAPLLLCLSAARALRPDEAPDDARILVDTAGTPWEVGELVEVLGAWSPAAAVAWTVDLSDEAEEPAAVLDRLQDVVGNRLAHVRLAGGGPEAMGQEGRGIGTLMARLALTGFRGSIGLAPSSPRYRIAWSHWLGRRGGWGCGGKGGDRDLVGLEPLGGAA